MREIEFRGKRAGFKNAFENPFLNLQEAETGEKMPGSAHGFKGA